MAKKVIRPIRTEAEYDEVLEEIGYFDNEPKPARHYTSFTFLSGRLPVPVRSG
jgi:antitoxin component HigA of HigAB toxin-antitoxin module